MKHIEFELQAGSDVSLYVQGWEPSEAPRGVIHLVHGLGEHSGRYAHLAEFLNQNGYSLLAFDLRGHGKSSGPRGHTPSYETLLEDISTFLGEAGRRYPGQPGFLYGHSLGGNLVLNYALRRRPNLRGVIATGPALRLAFAPPPAKIALGRIMNNLWPAFSQASGLETKALSQDPAIVQAYESDPLVHDLVSARLFVGFFQAGQWALEHADEFPLPLLLMHGGEDRITSPQASREFAAKVGDGCTLKIWDGLYHEIHNEPQKGQVFDTILDWLDARNQA